MRLLALAVLAAVVALVILALLPHASPTPPPSPSPSLHVESADGMAAWLQEHVTALPPGGALVTEAVYLAGEAPVLRDVQMQMACGVLSPVYQRPAWPLWPATHYVVGPTTGEWVVVWTGELRPCQRPYPFGGLGTSYCRDGDGIGDPRVYADLAKAATWSLAVIERAGTTYVAVVWREREE